MNDTPRTPAATLYAVKLIADPRGPGRLAGRVEHVLSGRLHDFEDGIALLTILEREQRQGYSIESPDPSLRSLPLSPFHSPAKDA